jgi:hypothetical protein
LLIIFGRRRKLFLLHRLYLACSMGHSAVHELIKQQTWIALFFIPVIPVRTRYSSKCTRCGRTNYLTKTEAVRLSLDTTPMPPEPEELPAPTGPAVAGPSPSAALEAPDAGRAAGWYPDPADGSKTRWWNGTAWTRTVQPRSSPAPEPGP